MLCCLFNCYYNLLSCLLCWSAPSCLLSLFKHFCCVYYGFCHVYVFVTLCFKAFWFFNEKFAQNASSTINQDPSDGEGEDCIAGGKSLKTACLSSKKIKEVLLLRWTRVWFLIKNNCLFWEVFSKNSCSTENIFRPRLPISDSWSQYRVLHIVYSTHPPLLQIVYIIRLDTNRNCCVYVMILENNRNCGVYVIRLENNRNCCSNNTYIKYIVKQYGSEGLYNDITYLYSWDFYNVHDTHKLRISILSWMNTFNCPCQHE